MKLIILDRDGVINADSEHYIKSIDEWIPLPGSIDAIARLSRAGYAVAVATNQSGLGRGYFSQADLEAMHHRLRELVDAAGGSIAGGIHYCPHRPEEGCQCRKPQPGLIDQIAEELGETSLAGCHIVGDSIRDLEAGVARGCKPVLVRTGKGAGAEQALPDFPALGTVEIFDDLASFTDSLLGTTDQ